MRKRIIASVLSVVGAVFLFYLACLHHTEVAHVGIMRNWVTGETHPDTPGWHLSAPWIKVAKVDLRPMRVCVTTAGKGRNCLLAQFNPQDWKEFVETEGFYYYWWANRISYNSDYDEEYRGFKDLLRGYAYSTMKYRFVTVTAGQ